MREGTPSFLLTQSPQAFLPILDWATWLRSLRGDKLDSLRMKQNQKIHSRQQAKGCLAAGTTLQLDYCKILEWMQPVYLVLCTHYFTLHIHSCWASVIVNMDKAVPHQAAENAEATQNMRWSEREQFHISVLMRNKSQAVELSEKSTAVIKCKFFFIWILGYKRIPFFIIPVITCLVLKQNSSAN